MSGEKLDEMTVKEQTLVVWEWLLYPVGTSVYVISAFFYWVFRRLRRRYYEGEVPHYHPECFEPNHSLIEFVLARKLAKTKAIEEGLKKSEQDQMKGQ